MVENKTTQYLAYMTNFKLSELITFGFTQA